MAAFKVSGEHSPEDIVHEAAWLAWQACGGPVGMGFLQNNPTATKADVINHIFGDDRQPPNKMFTDYVFGRMMKLRLEWDGDTITYPESQPRADYQAWCVTYPTYQDLLLAAVSSIDSIPAK